MTDDDIKNAIKSIEIHQEHGWWVADMPDIGVATQARTLPELGIEIERIVVGHFAVNAEHGIDPFRCKRPSLSEDLAETLRVVLEGHAGTYASIASAMRKIEQQLRATAVLDAAELDRIRAEVTASAAAVAAVASLAETPLTTKVR